MFFTINAFGQRVPCKPMRLRFIEQPEGTQGGAPTFLAPPIPTPPPAPQVPAGSTLVDGEVYGYPANTPVAEMSDAQRAEYWRKESKTQQRVNESHKDYDALAVKAAAHDKYLSEHATDEEKAREEARREGEVIGAEKYLKDAVVGKFQALTGRTDDEVATTFEHVDPKSFLDDKGEIVAEKLKAFAATFGPKDAGGKGDPVAEALARQKKAGGGSGSSIADKRKETRESLTKSKA